MYTYILNTHIQNICAYIVNTCIRRHTTNTPAIYQRYITYTILALYTGVDVFFPNIRLAEANILLNCAFFPSVCRLENFAETNNIAKTKKKHDNIYFVNIKGKLTYI